MRLAVACRGWLMHSSRRCCLSLPLCYRLDLRLEPACLSGEREHPALGRGVEQGEQIQREVRLVMEVPGARQPGPLTFLISVQQSFSFLLSLTISVPQ